MRSMTGYGNGKTEKNGWEVTVDLKTVNHRFLDMSLRLPRNLAFLEQTVREQVGMQMDGVITLTEAEMDEDAVIAACEEAADAAAAQVTQMRDKEGIHLKEDLKTHLDAAAILREKFCGRAPTVVAE